MAASRTEAPPLVLLHGIGANSMHWRFQFAAFAEHFRVIAWNAPGYMLSDNLLAETPDWVDYAEALGDFLTALGVGRFDLLANSFGTRVAQCFAYRSPDRIGRAVFTGASIAQGTAPEERARIAEGRAKMIAQGGYGFGARAEALLGSRASADTLRLVRHTLRARLHAGGAVHRKRRHAAAWRRADDAAANDPRRRGSRHPGCSQRRTYGESGAACAACHACGLRPLA